MPSFCYYMYIGTKNDAHCIANNWTGCFSWVLLERCYPRYCRYFFSYYWCYLGMVYVLVDFRSNFRLTVLQILLYCTSKLNFCVGAKSYVN